MSVRQSLLIGFIAIVLLVVWWVRPQRQEISAAQSTGTPEALLFKLPAVLGSETYSLVQYNGEVRILAFWATWCGPCREELPLLIRLQKEFGPRGLQVLGMNVDEDPNDVRRFSSEMNFNFPNLAVNRKVLDDYGGINSIPTLVIIDRHGHVEEMAEGLVEEQSLRELIQKLIERP